MPDIEAPDEMAGLPRRRPDGGVAGEGTADATAVRDGADGIGIDGTGIDRVGIDRVGIDRVGIDGTGSDEAHRGPGRGGSGSPDPLGGVCGPDDADLTGPEGGRVPDGESAPHDPPVRAEPGWSPHVAVPERLARAALARLTEPGDVVLGRWLGEAGAAEVVRRIAEGGRCPSSVGAGRLAGYRARLAGIDPESDLRRVAAHGGRFVCPGDPEWPTQLDDLGPARPVGLWVVGAASLRLLMLRSVAVVGARACTAYGSHVAGRLAADLAESGWVVVSGCAYGIDAAAHRGALAVGGTTVGVLACGVDTAYPRGHTELLRRIAQQGLLVSELAPGEHPTRVRFVLRNRVIAALTRGTVVVEAAVRSGALSTARRARDLNRLLMGVPGPVTSELSSGVNELLRTGTGTVVTNAAEVVELVGGIGTDLAPVRRGPGVPLDVLEPAALRVLEALPGGAAGAPTAEVVCRAGLAPDEVAQRLQELASLGFVERAGGTWRLTPRRPG